MLLALLLGVSCATTLTPEQKAQREKISQEPKGIGGLGVAFISWKHGSGDTFVVPENLGRRSRLVLMNESYQKAPDRLPEEPETGWAHGYDHNCEYRVWGSFSGDAAYDPNSDLILHEFTPTKFELISRRPGFVMRPGDSVNQRELPRWY